MVPRGRKLQAETVALLCLIALFTQVHLLWIAALLLALIDIPDIGGWMRSIGALSELLGSNPQKTRPNPHARKATPYPAKRKADSSSTRSRLMLELLTHSKSGPAECGGVSPPTERRATYVSAFQPIFDIDQGGIIAGVLAFTVPLCTRRIHHRPRIGTYFSSRRELPVSLSQTPSSKENEIGRGQA
jgi:hypothetical protein